MDTYSYWIYRGDINGGWVELMNSLDKHWNKTGTHVFNTNTGNIGMGTNNPTQKLAINATDPAIDFMNAGSSKGYLQANGNNMRLATYANNTTGNIVFNTKAVDRMWIDETGKIGIGTASPTGLLTVNGTNPWIEIQNNGVDKGFLQATGNDLKLGTNSSNTTGNLVFQTKLTDRMLIDENGNVGIGTTTPSTALTVNSINPIVQLRNNNTDIGFVQLVDDDIKIGTNSSNIGGKFIVRTYGADRIFVDKNGDVQVGNGNDGSLIVDSENPIFRLQRNNVDLFYTYANSLGNKDVSLQRNSQGSGNGYLILNNGAWGRIYISEDGHVNMGTGRKPAGYRLSVEGKVIATDFTTSAINNWPDYVFANDYKLKTLAEVKKFITENKHLPNIPPAAEIEKNGLQLGDMNKRLMEKVEELTLYIIDMQEQIDTLKKSK
jgi:hypothetical protein